MAASYDFLANLHSHLLFCSKLALDEKNYEGSDSGCAFFNGQDHVDIQLWLLDKNGSRSSIAQSSKWTNKTNYLSDREVQDNWTNREDFACLLPPLLGNLLLHSHVYRIHSVLQARG